MKLLLAGSVTEIDLIVFDCDGVLLDTMPAKIEAFRTWVPEKHADLRDAFMEYIMTGFGFSRMYHIEHFYNQLVGQSTDPTFIHAEVDRFSSICEPLVAAAPWRTGSREFVQRCIEAGIKRYVLSGTPQQPLEEMLASSGGDQLFDVIIGAPLKPQSMDRIMAETAISPERTLFVGDANADQQAALHVGAHFVYMPSEAERPKAEILTETEDLRTLLL